MARSGVRIGVNSLYLIPGGVGGTEIYLRELLAALAALDQTNEYLVFTNRETPGDLVPKQANFHSKPQAVRARELTGLDLLPHDGRLPSVQVCGQVGTEPAG